MKRFVVQAWLSFKGQRAAFSFEEFITLDTLYPLVTMIFYCLLAAYSFNTTNLTKWVVGNSFLLCTNTCIFSLGQSFTSERYFGRLRSIIVSPMSKMEIVLHKGMFPCITCIGTVFVGFFLGSLIFGVPLTNVNWGLFILIMIVAMVSATGFGLFISVFGLITDQMHFILNVVSYLLILFCGANFPVSQLPMAGQFMSKILPLTRSIQAANLLFEGGGRAEFTRLLMGEILVGCVYFAMAFLIIKYVEKVAIKKASLEVF